MAAASIQVMYGCEDCKHAADIHGRSCDCGDFFPILLVMGGMGSCPNYEKDIEKVKEIVRRKESKNEED